MSITDEPPGSLAITHLSLNTQKDSSSASHQLTGQLWDLNHTGKQKQIYVAAWRIDKLLSLWAAA